MDFREFERERAIGKKQKSRGLCLSSCALYVTSCLLSPYSPLNPLLATSSTFTDADDISGDAASAAAVVVASTGSHCWRSDLATIGA